MPDSTPGRLATGTCVADTVLCVFENHPRPGDGGNSTATPIEHRRVLDDGDNLQRACRAITSKKKTDRRATIPASRIASTGEERALCNFGLLTNRKPVMNGGRYAMFNEDDRVSAQDVALRQQIARSGRDGQIEADGTAVIDCTLRAILRGHTVGIGDRTGTPVQGLSPTRDAIGDSSSYGPRQVPHIGSGCSVVETRVCTTFSS